MPATASQMLRPMCRTLVTSIVALALLAASAPAAAANEDDLYIVQTNAAGDNVHLIDPATNEIVAEITGVEVIHGVAGAPDGSKLYLSNESAHFLNRRPGNARCVVCHSDAEEWQTLAEWVRGRMSR